MSEDAPGGLDWLSMTPRQFDEKAPDVQLGLFAQPDDCGSFDTLFGDDL